MFIKQFVEKVELGVINRVYHMSETPKSYGRQSSDKTIKSVSLDKRIADLVEQEAQRRGMSFSALVNAILNGDVQPTLMFLASEKVDADKGK